MICPHCNHEHSTVIDTRTYDDTIKRIRRCEDCGKPFITWEILDAQIAVIQINETCTIPK